MDKIDHSVGRGGVNKEADVRIVQALLNRHIVPPSRLLRVDGIAGANTKGAILAFQHRMGMTKCDGLIMPAGRTFNALRAVPYSVPLSERALNAFHTFSKIIGEVGDGLSKPSVRATGHQYSSPVPMHALPPSPQGAIAWGAKVTPQFKKKVIDICVELRMNPDYLMACMAFETGESFKASQRNMSGGGAIGLVQFTKPAIDDLNRTYNIQPPLSRARLSEMSEVQQLDYVRLYFLHYKGKLNSIEDVYMVILAPVAVGRGPAGTVYREDDIKHPEYYRQNKGLDKAPRDGVITLKECSSVLNAKFKKGLSKGYFG